MMSYAPFAHFERCSCRYRGSFIVFSSLLFLRFRLVSLLNPTQFRFERNLR
jgi:hypothetical protein